MSSRVKYFRDSVHKFIEIPREHVLPLIDTPEFQRLRRLSQLGTSAVTYPCAEHTRFQHSLGVAHLFRILAAHFDDLGTPLSEEELLVGTLAALLHDIGHGPFSHALEGVLVPQKRHEEWTQEVILSDETAVRRSLDQIDRSLAERVADVIGKRSPNGILVNMISSQLDVDRMDYLLRDSQTVGVPYGKYDLDRLIRMLGREGDTVVIDRRGLHNVEEYLLARYHMYWQVYFHRTTRGYECMLKAVWKRVKHLVADSRLELDGVTPAVRAALRSTGQLSVKDYLSLDNYDVYVALKAWKYSGDKVLAELSSRLLDRKLLKPIEVDNHSIWERQPLVSEVLKRAGYDPDYYLLSDRSSDVAYDYYTAEEGEQTKPPIHVREESGKLIEISKISAAVNAIARERQIRFVIYVPQECRDEVKRILNG